MSRMLVIPIPDRFPLWQFLHRPTVMFRSRFTALAEPASPLFVIGDIHGCLDQFNAMIDQIEQDIAARSLEGAVIVTVGDYVDRGPDSRGVLERVVALEQDPNRQFVPLLGNHEDMLLTFLSDPLSKRRWLRIGGAETLESYGIAPLDEDAAEEDLLAASVALRDAMGPEQIACLAGLETGYRSGNVFVCHAGTDPAIPVDQQERKTLIWNRDYKKIRKDGIWTAHGHTVTSKATAENGRINVDTGAVFTGRLTAARVFAGEIDFLQVF